MNLRNASRAPNRRRLAHDDRRFGIRLFLKRLIPEVDLDRHAVNARPFLRGQYELPHIQQNAALFHAALHRPIAADGNCAE